MLNVSWENTDFSFNSDGYLVNPSMIIITLDRGRQWDKVRMFFLLVQFNFLLPYSIQKVASPMASSILTRLRRFHCPQGSCESNCHRQIACVPQCYSSERCQLPLFMFRKWNIKLNIYVSYQC